MRRAEKRDKRLKEAAALLAEVARRGQMIAHWKAIVSDAGTFETTRRISLRCSHPDRGGSQEEFLRVQTAVELLKRHHGLR